MPPLLTSLFLVFVAARTGWFPIGGMRRPVRRRRDARSAAPSVVPALALGLPLAAMFERLQAQAMSEVIGAAVRAGGARARRAAIARRLARRAEGGAPAPWRRSTASIVGTLLSGSFAVEVITAWPGLGRLMLDALRARDIYLVAGCAAAGALFLACGTLLSDVALGARRSARQRARAGRRPHRSTAVIGAGGWHRCIVGRVAARGGAVSRAARARRPRSSAC